MLELSRRVELTKQLSGIDMLTEPERDVVDGAERGPGREPEHLLKLIESLLKLIESLKDYAVARVDLEGRVVAWNNAAARLTGYTAKEVLGAESGEFLCTRSGSRTRVKRLLDRAVASGRYWRKGWVRR